jgi:hypothetical protein
MKLIPIILTHRLSILGDDDVDVPVHLYTNRLEGDINLNGLVSAKQFVENGVNMTMFTMNYVDIRISFLKRHKKSFDNWTKECYEGKLTTSKKNLVFHGLFDRVECYGSYISALELNKSQEILSISCDKMCYVVETQVLSRKVRQALENLA